MVVTNAHPHCSSLIPGGTDIRAQIRLALPTNLNLRTSSGPHRGEGMCVIYGLQLCDPSTPSSQTSATCKGQGQTGIHPVVWKSFLRSLEL